MWCIDSLFCAPCPCFGMSASTAEARLLPKHSRRVQAGNKGACAVSFTVSGGGAGDGAAEPTRMLLLCCHLEAHSHRLQRRNANLRHILSTLHLKPPRSRRGLSQTLLTSFLPSHMSPLRGRSRSRASAADSRLITSTSCHARGHSLPANTPAFNPQAGWMAAQLQQPEAGLRGIAEGAAHTRSQSLQGRQPSCSVAVDASQCALRAQGSQMECSRRTRRSASMPSGSMASLVTDARAAPDDGPAVSRSPEGTADLEAGPGPRSSHPALVASLQHWDCSRADVGSDSESESGGSGSVCRPGDSGNGSHCEEGGRSSGMLGVVARRYSGSEYSDSSGLSDCSTPVEPQHQGAGEAGHGGSGGGGGGGYGHVRSISGECGARRDEDLAPARGLPEGTGDSLDLLRREGGWGSAREGARRLLRQVSRSADDLRQAVNGVRARVAGVPAELPGNTTPRAATPPPGALAHGQRGDSALTHGAPPTASSGRRTPDLRGAMQRLGREISTPKLASGLLGGSGKLQTTPLRERHTMLPLQRAVDTMQQPCALPKYSLRAARLRADLRAAADDDDSALAAAVCEGARAWGSGSECSSMNLGDGVDDGDADSLDGALSSSSDAPHSTAAPGLAVRYREHAMGHTGALADSSVPAVVHSSAAPRHGHPGGSVMHLNRGKEARRAQAVDAPLRARHCDVAPGSQKEDLPLTARQSDEPPCQPHVAATERGAASVSRSQGEVPLRGPRGRSRNVLAREGSMHSTHVEGSRRGRQLRDQARVSPPPQPVVEGLRPGSGGSSGSSDMRDAPASPGAVSHVQLLGQMAELMVGRTGGEKSACAVDQVAPPSPFAWRCTSRRPVRSPRLCSLRK